ALAVLGTEAMDAADDEAAQLGNAPARPRDRLRDQELPLPLLHVPDDDDERRGGLDAELSADGCAASAGEATHVDAVVDRDEAAGADPTAAVVLADLVGHADGGIDPARAEAIDRTDAPEALEVADHGYAAAGGGEHAGEIRGEAAREIHQRGTL